MWFLQVLGHHITSRIKVYMPRRVGRWKLSSGPWYINPGGRGWLISYAFSIICFRKQIYQMSYLQFPSFPSFLLSFFPFSLLLVSSFLPFLFCDCRQWQLEINPEFSVSFYHIFQWRGVIGKTDCLKEITPILFLFLCNSRDYNPHLSSHFYIITWGGWTNFFFAFKI